MKFGYIAKTRVDDIFDEFYRKIYAEECPNVEAEIDKLKQFDRDFGNYWEQRRESDNLEPIQSKSPTKAGKNHRSKNSSVFLTQKSTKSKLRSRSTPVVATDQKDANLSKDTQRTAVFENDKFALKNKEYLLKFKRRGKIRYSSNLIHKKLKDANMRRVLTKCGKKGRMASLNNDKRTRERGRNRTNISKIQNSQFITGDVKAKL